LEPAQAAVPVLVGPYTHNFRDIVGIFREANAILVVPPEPEALAAIFTDLVRNPERRTLLGGRAQHVFRSQAGATFRTAEALVRLLHAGRGSKESPQVEHAGL
jgi:3-deoxy-D-manno-octulosonic-acid transferase